jgi:hypothetical protein
MHFQRTVALYILQKKYHHSCRLSSRHIHGTSNHCNGCGDESKCRSSQQSLVLRCWSSYTQFISKLLSWNLHTSSISNYQLLPPEKAIASSYKDSNASRQCFTMSSGLSSMVASQHTLIATYICSVKASI